MNRIFFFSIFSAILFTACEKENTKPSSLIDKHKISVITENNIVTTLWADNTTLQTGYNRLYISLEDMQGNEMKNAVLTYSPLMDMGTKKHSSPAEQPHYNNDLKLYEGAVVFTMPTSEMGSWQLDVSVNGKIITFPLTIQDAPRKNSGVYAGTDENKYVLALIPPVKWQVGLNDLEILISRQVSMMEFTGAEGFTVVFTPEMPSMDHGSPNNISPVSTGNGRYKGKVNYTMTGDWRLHFKLKKNDEVIVEDAYVDILF
ncbi:MAG: FixH family protein [Chitinophagaceae bacterium]|nr:FixH family protein [Chitinophagaceae bacterium]